MSSIFLMPGAGKTQLTQELTMAYKKPNFSSHGETDRKNSWYWSVLLKNLGNWVEAQKAIEESRKRVDVLYERDKIIRI